VVFGKLKAIFHGLSRGHPDVYEALKNYCDEKGLNITDVAAAAIASYLASTDEGKEELETAMAKRRISGGSAPDIRATINLIKDLSQAMTEMFKAVNEARAGASTASMLADFKAMSDFLNQVKETASESGKGSVEDLLATMIMSRLFGGIQPAGKVKTPSGKVKEVEEG